MTNNNLNSPEETEKIAKTAGFFNTFDVLHEEISELLDQRSIVFIAFLTLTNKGWYSKRSSDRCLSNGWFFAGVELEGKQIWSYIPIEYLELAKVKLKEIEQAPKWDGDPSNGDGTLERIIEWLKRGSHLVP